jgi:trimethylamine:corrinoid methyltransferase-like protein
MTNEIPFNLFSLTRPSLIDEAQSARIHALAKQILSEIGMEVVEPHHAALLADSGLKFIGSRVVFDPAQVDAFVDELRSSRLAQPQLHSTLADTGQISLSVSSYPLFIHNLHTGAVVPAVEQNLIEMAKLVDSLADARVAGAPPGIPTDVHPDLQPLAQYRIAANYSRQGATPVDPTSSRTVEFLFEMAEVMGKPITGLPVYIPTPLRLGGESLGIVLAMRDRLDEIWVSSMPSCGTSAPIEPFAALALAAAEVIGGAIAVQSLTSKPVSFGAQIFPSDLREGSMVFGSPENMLYQMLNADFNRFYGGRGNGSPDNIHVMAKLPDCQSAAEKAAIMMTGAALGSRHFSCAGTLSLDEIFSGEQLILDCEIRDWVQRSIAGVWMSEDTGRDWVEDIRSGIQRGFLGHDSTLDTYRMYVWYPKFFQRGAIGPWMKENQPQLSARLRAEARRRIAAHDFELDRDRRAELDRIYLSACKAVGI